MVNNMHETTSEEFVKDYAYVTALNLFEQDDPLFKDYLRQLTTAFLGYRKLLLAGPIAPSDILSIKSPPSPPAEMPEIDPKTLKLDHCGDSQIPPILTGACIRYGQKIGKKEANSCVGCTVGCTGKGKQEPEKN